MTDLFGNISKAKKIVRTLGYYQPFCSLMLRGKKETRWVRKGKKPPFPLGDYVFYSTKKPCTNAQLFKWSGAELMLSISTILKGEETVVKNGYIIGGGELHNLRLMTKEDELNAFVKFVGERTVKDKRGNDVIQVQWILEFKNVYRIEPAYFKEGKQGVGILSSVYEFGTMPKEPNPEECDATKPLNDPSAGNQKIKTK